jgi:large subunit ribosomal protein L22
MSSINQKKTQGGPEPQGGAKPKPRKRIRSTKKVQAERKKALAQARPPQATGRFLRHPPDKVRIMARNVVGSPVGLAMDLLRYSPRKSSALLLKVLKGAISSAENDKGEANNVDSLVVKRVLVDRGPMIKRFHPCAHGRAKPILKRFCHITVVLGDMDDRRPSGGGKRPAPAAGF